MVNGRSCLGDRKREQSSTSKEHKYATLNSAKAAVSQHYAILCQVNTIWKSLAMFAIYNKEKLSNIFVWNSAIYSSTIHAKLLFIAMFILPWK